jgi:ethanolamine utilization protein EutQ (cupin superfamily)
MPKLISVPTRIPVPGGKLIDEYIGLANTGDKSVSVARMVAPAGWSEPAQTPEFDEITVVLRGCVQVQHDGGLINVKAGQVVLTRAGEKVRYTTPAAEGAEYLAICLPAFSPDTVHRDE